MLTVQRQRVEKAISDMINDMYKSDLRKMQSQMHLCASKCCDNIQEKPTMDKVQDCIENCAEPLLKAQEIIQHQLTQFQMHLQGCVMKCNDDIRGQVPGRTQDADQDFYRKKFEHCTVQCVDNHIALIPKIKSTVKSALSECSPLRQV